MAKTSQQLANEVADDFKLTFHRDADGGPQHVLFQIRGFHVILKKDGVALVEGTITYAEDTDESVEVQAYDEKTGLNNGPIVRIPWGDFDEVLYL